MITKLEKFRRLLEEQFGSRLILLDRSTYVNSSTAIEVRDVELRRDVYVVPDYVRRGIYNPDYFWMKGGVVLRRTATRRSCLPTLLGDRFNPILSEAANMSGAGWTRIWGSGHSVWRYPTTL